ncbi:phage tail protein, partial [Salmonella enterica subsp. enterica serovar Enteritidis]
MLTPVHSQFAQQAPSQKAGIMPFTTVFCIFINLGLGETINLAKNAVPVTRRINSKPLSGDISLWASDVGAISA